MGAAESQPAAQDRKEDPAILPPLEIQTIEGAKLRKGYTIPFNLPPEALEEMREELKTNEAMGVLGDAPMGSTLVPSWTNSG